MFIDSAASNVLKYHNGSGWVTLGSGSVTFPLNSNVAGTANAPIYSWNGASADTGMFLPATDTIGFSTNSAEVMRLNANGVGIGTTNPQEELHVNNDVLTGDKHPYAANSTQPGFDKLDLLRSGT